MDRLDAFKNGVFARRNAGEFIDNLKLKGRAGERGMVFVVPIFKLFGFPLNSVRKADESGQVIAVDQETAKLALPVSARIPGLKSRA